MLAARTLAALVACLVLYAFVVWNVARVHNNCVYEGVKYQYGDYRPDGECICVSGYSHQEWVWNCRESWGR
jgi:hypothetical protein